MHTLPASGLHTVPAATLPPTGIAGWAERLVKQAASHFRGSGVATSDSESTQGRTQARQMSNTGAGGGGVASASAPEHGRLEARIGGGGEAGRALESTQRSQGHQGPSLDGGKSVGGVEVTAPEPTLGRLGRRIGVAVAGGVGGGAAGGGGGGGVGGGGRGVGGVGVAGGGEARRRLESGTFSKKY